MVNEELEKIIMKADSDYEAMKDRLHELYEENERLKEWKEDLLKENIELENIRKEAIEYIKEHCEIVRFEDESVDMIGKVEGIPLLNILQNGGEE